MNIRLKLLIIPGAMTVSFYGIKKVNSSFQLPFVKFYFNIILLLIN